MDLHLLQQHIRNLAIVRETDSPVVSCYLNLESGVAGCRNALNERVGKLRKNLTGKSLADFEDALALIEEYLRTAVSRAAKGVALFARGGSDPFFFPLQFRVPLPNWIGVNSTPNIYHLVELKDTYHRFVVMIATDRSARIVEVNLGEVTRELWNERPELRKRVGREWTKRHYQSHARERTEGFFKEMIRILDHRMAAGGYTHLILAGKPHIVSRIRKALPANLSSKLVDCINASGDDRVSDVVAATLCSFVEQEELESLAAVEQLQQEVSTSGLAVIGTEDTLRALQVLQVDMLVIAKEYAPDPGWSCPNCGAVGILSSNLASCQSCGHPDIHRVDLREEMVRIAERSSGRTVEVVSHSDLLMHYGGVGALLRYLPAEQYWRKEHAET